MSAIAPHSQEHIFYKKVDVQLTFCDRVTKFALAFLATLPLFIGLCFKSIRAYWVQAWTGKTTILEKMAPTPIAVPPKMVTPSKPALPKIEPQIAPVPTAVVDVEPPSTPEPEKMPSMVKDGLAGAGHGLAFPLIFEMCCRIPHMALYPHFSWAAINYISMGTFVATSWGYMYYFKASPATLSGYFGFTTAFFSLSFSAFSWVNTEERLYASVFGVSAAVGFLANAYLAQKLNFSKKD